ncbi:hypothetical protein AB1484_15605 [Parafrankia sp. FMc6]
MDAVAGRNSSRYQYRPSRMIIISGLAAVALVVAVTGCGSDGDPAPAPPPTPSSTPAPSPTPASAAADAERQAVDAYVSLWNAMAEASQTSNWQSPELGRYASGSALQVLSGSLYADHLNGFESRGAPVLQPRATSAEPAAAPTTVMLFDCADSTNWLQYRADGSLVDDEPGGRRAVTSEVRLHQDGSWKVTRFAVEGLGSC